MANNNFTEIFEDGTSLNQFQIETACKSLTLDIGNTTQMTAGSTSGTFLKSNGDGVAASWGTPADPLGPFAIRNYGLSTAVSVGALTVSLKTNAGNTPSSGDAVDIPFSNNGATSATYTALQVISALSFTITASATLGFTGTSTNRVFVYAINNAGTVRLAVSARADLDTASTTTTTQMTSAADSSTVLYATATLTVVPRMLGWIDAALNATGSWQAANHCGVRNNAGSADEMLQGVTSKGANVAINNYTRTVATGSATAGVRSVVISNSSSTFTTSNTSATTVTNLVVSITTSGRPIALQLTNDDSTNAAQVGCNGTTVNLTVRFIRSGLVIISTQSASLSGAGSNFIPSSTFRCIDTPGAGTYFYNVTIAASATPCRVFYTKLVAYEL